MRGAWWAVAGLLAAAVPAAGEDAAVPFPLDGELWYYQGTLKAEPGEPRRVEQGIRILGPLEVLDRDGQRRAAFGVETTLAVGQVHGTPEGLLADPEAFRQLGLYDLASFDLLEHRDLGRSRFEAGWPLGPVRALPQTSGSASAAREFVDPGAPLPWAAFWGRSVPADAVPAIWHVGHSVSYAAARMTDAEELLGLRAGAVEATRDPVPRRHIEAPLVPIDRAVVGGREATRFTAAYSYDTGRGASVAPALEAWTANGIAWPLRTVETNRYERPGDPLEIQVDLTLAAHRVGVGPLPWGRTGAGGAAFEPELGRLGAYGPEDGSARLAYPLREAIASVRGDLTLRAFRALHDPVLVKAYHEVRAAEDVGSVPQARWWMLFRDADGGEAIVESKRPLGLPASVNREQADRSARAGPDVGRVAPSELPARAPTVGGALRAWEYFRLGGTAGPPMVVYALQRMADGTVEPIVWAGALARVTAPDEDLRLASHEAMSLLGVDVDGRPLAGLDLAWDWRQGLAGAHAAAGPVPRAAPAAPAGPPILEASVGLAALVALLKLLAPLYSRLDRRQVLDHPARRALLELVAREPGIHLDAAQQALRLGAGTLAHHVHVLAGAGLLRAQRGGRFRRLYPAETPPAAVVQDAALRQPRAAALHGLVRARPGVGLREASRQLGVPVSSLQWHADRLVEAGLLERRPDGLHPAPG